MFYAGYDHIDTDVAMFATKRKRDEWLHGDSFFNRIPLDARDVSVLVGKNPQRQEDDIDSSIIWLLNPCA